MVFFLIPIGIVGYKMWEKHQLGETERRRQEEIEGPEVLVTDRNNEGLLVDSPCEEDSIVPVDMEENRGPMVSVASSAVKQEQKRPRLSFRIRTKKEALTYAVIGNQAANAMPFPRVSYN
jgi:hypothetical protein